MNQLDELSRNDAELKLLASIVAHSAPPDYESFQEVRCEITENAFMGDECRLVFSAIDKAVNDGVHLTPRAISDRLQRRSPEISGLLASVVAYSRTPHASLEHQRYYLGAIRDSHIPTRLKDVLSEAIALLENGLPVHDVHARLDLRSTEILESDRPLALDFAPMVGAAHAVLEELRQIWGGSLKDRPFLPTQFPTLNTHLGGGFYLKHECLIAARPSVGKTALWEQIVQNWAEDGTPGIVNTLEMEPGEHLLRMAIRDSCIETPMSEIMDPSFMNQRMTYGENIGQLKREILADSMERISKLPIMALSQERDLTDMVRKLRRCIRQWPEEWSPPKYFVLDYLQLVKAPGWGCWSRPDEVGTISVTLRDFCRDHGMTFIPTAQFNRNIEEQDRLPRMSDLRESGQLEQDAHILLFPHRSVQDAPPSNQDQEASFVVAKARSGLPGVVPATWRGSKIKFSEREVEWEFPSVEDSDVPF